MNDATRKRLEAAGWYRLPIEDGRGLWQHRSKAGRWTVEMSFRDDNPKTNRAALRAFIEAFEEEKG